MASESSLAGSVRKRRPRVGLRPAGGRASAAAMLESQPASQCARAWPVTMSLSAEAGTSGRVSRQRNSVRPVPSETMLTPTVAPGGSSSR
ncbi:MAG: hypothetical protein R6X14_10030 [bacterium]